MIIKKLKIPIRVVKGQAVLQRLPLNHRKRRTIEADLTNRTSGFEGEKSTDYYLERLPRNDYFIFHDLRLSNDSNHFQMDLLLLHPKFILIVEVKNMAGELYFDTKFNQLIQEINGKKNRYQDPVIQVSEHREQLQLWLGHLDYQVPIEVLVCMSNKEAIIEVSPDDPTIHKKVVNLERLKGRIIEIENTYVDPVMNKQTMNELSSLLIKGHCPPETDILREYDLNKKEILQGVICPACGALPMKREHGKWHCKKCKATSITAHIQTLREYKLLFSSKITNSECCDFLQLTSRHTAKRLLSSQNQKYTGPNSRRVYYL